MNIDEDGDSYFYRSIIYYQQAKKVTRCGHWLHHKMRLAIEPGTVVM
jgi:hypothetical protein